MLYEDATAIILATFLGGLSLGYFLCGKFSTRIKQPLLETMGKGLKPAVGKRVLSEVEYFRGNSPTSWYEFLREFNNTKSSQFLHTFFKISCQLGSEF